MGDLIQSSPLVGGLKAGMEDVEISMLVSSHFKDVASLIPGVDRVIDISLHDVVTPIITDEGSIMTAYRMLEELSGYLNDIRFDHVINITHTHYSAVIAALVRCRSLAGMSIDNEGYKIVHGDWANYYLNSCLNRAFNRFNLVDMHCRIGDVNPGVKLALDVPHEARTRADTILKEFHRPGYRIIGLVPGASSCEKAWQPEMFARVVDELRQSLKVVPLIFGAESETGLGRRLRELLPDAIDLCGRTDFPLLSALIGKCNLLITNDTGPMHIAAAVGTRVVDISLGSALSHETAPYGEGHLIVEPDIDCYPCHVKMRCSHCSCHDRIHPAAVARLARISLDNKPISYIQDEPVFTGVNVLRTAFDDDDWWELVPMLHRPLRLTDLYNHALREMWKRALSGGIPWMDDYWEAARKIGNKLTRWYKPASEPDLSAGADTLLRELVSLASIGLKSVRELALIGDNGGDMKRITKLGAILKEVDQGLIRMAYEHPEVKPLVAQFTYGKDNMTGWQLSSLAEQTAKLYNDLIAWGEALPNWIEGMVGKFESLKV